MKFSHNEQHVIIIFLWARSLNANQIDFEMHPVYGDKCSMKRQFTFDVRKW